LKILSAFYGFGLELWNLISGEFSNDLIYDIAKVLNDGVMTESSIVIESYLDLFCVF
jgi:hypothetical protein